jgi:hypothetical protein
MLHLQQVDSVFFGLNRSAQLLYNSGEINTLQKEKIEVEHTRKTLLSSLATLQLQMESDYLKEFLQFPEGELIPAAETLIIKNHRPVMEVLKNIPDKYNSPGEELVSWKQHVYRLESLTVHLEFYTSHAIPYVNRLTSDMNARRQYEDISAMQLKDHVLLYLDTWREYIELVNRFNSYVLRIEQHINELNHEK